MINTAKGLKTIMGRMFAMSHKNELVSNGKRITHPCVDATVTVSDESANVRTITIQLLDAKGNDISEPTTVGVNVWLDANGTNQVVTGGSTGIQIGTDGEILSTPTAKKQFVVRSEDDGDIDLTWTDTGTEAAYVSVVLPNGCEVFGSQALTNA